MAYKDYSPDGVFVAEFWRNKSKSHDIDRLNQSKQPLIYRQCFGHYAESRCLINAMVHGDCEQERQCKEVI